MTEFNATIPLYITDIVCRIHVERIRNFCRNWIDIDHFYQMSNTNNMD